MRSAIVLALIALAELPAGAAPQVRADVGEDIDAIEVVRAARPDLAPAPPPGHGQLGEITTRSVVASGVAEAHPVHEKTSAYAIDTVCDESYCVEALAIGGHVAISGRRALAQLRAHVSDPGHEDEVDATEVVLPQPSAAGYFSIYRIESDFTSGAAHARTTFTCESYRSSGKRATLRDVIGKAGARRAVAAATKALADTPDHGGFRIDAASFLVPTAGTVVLCAIGDPGWASGSIAPVAIEITR